MYARKRKVDLSNPPPKRRKSKVPAIEEIAFDFSAREDFLTGFHKRKLQRVKQAREQAAERERLERIEARQKLREERKAEVERHVNEVNALLRKTEEPNRSDTEGQSNTGSGSWGGVEEIPDHQDEFSDDDNHTTVVVEAVGVTKDGLHKLPTEADSEVESSNQARKHTTELMIAPTEATLADSTGKRAKTLAHQKGPKKRKKKFRYESKAERKEARQKEKSGNKAKAKSRKS